MTGDPSYNASNVSWELQSGALPAGLSLGTDGVLSGIPTTKDTVGSSFQVKATYKTKSGQQAYTIVVNGAVLHVTQISAGGYHTCALTTAGGVKCWGADNYGQLGNDASLTDKLIPVDVLGLTSGVTSISAGKYHTCALITAGGVKCWGYDLNGQLGNDTSLTDKPTPVDVQGLTSGVASISAGVYHTCAVTTAGGAKCWGANGLGQLGNGNTTQKPTPVDVQGLTFGVTSISTGQFHTCALTTSGGLKCWGYDGYGQLGDDDVAANKLTAVDVFGLTSGVVNVSTGQHHTCAVTAEGNLKCWGYNNVGQLGDNSATNKLTPVDVQGLTSGVARVSAGVSHTCAVTTAGGAKCWGLDTQGQLGDNSTTSKPTPVDVWGLTSGVASISCGGYHTCAVTTTGAAKCWGYSNYGQLGNNSTTSKPTPVDVAP